jgi:ferredoxin
MSAPLHQYRVSFSGATHPPVTLDCGAVLSEHLTIANSPVLFGCRTGICGTCLIEVEEEQNGQLRAPSVEELELLDIVAPDLARARLACQIALSADIRIHYIGPG